jgi:TfoX/Sxy family transcriptional regulator of competence genes
MSSDQSFVDYICGQLSGVPRLSQRKMFGEYALYANDKIVALVCDNQLFVKPTAAGRAMLGVPLETPPYPQAKPWFLIEGAIEDAAFMSGLINATEAELPVPKPKKLKAESVKGPPKKAKKRAAKK